MADVPEALRDACPHVQQAHAAVAAEVLQKEVVQPRGKILCQIVHATPQAVAEHLARVAQPRLDG